MNGKNAKKHQYFLFRSKVNGQLPGVLVGAARQALYVAQHITQLRIPLPVGPITNGYQKPVLVIGVFVQSILSREVQEQLILDGAEGAFRERTLFLPRNDQPVEITESSGVYGCARVADSLPVLRCANKSLLQPKSVLPGQSLDWLLVDPLLPKPMLRSISQHSGAANAGMHIGITHRKKVAFVHLILNPRPYQPCFQRGHFCFASNLCVQMEAPLPTDRPVRKQGTPEIGSGLCVQVLSAKPADEGYNEAYQGGEGVSCDTKSMPCSWAFHCLLSAMRGGFVRILIGC